MGNSLETIESEALRLTAGQRLTLAHRMLASVEGEPEAGAEDAWDLEIKERIQKYDAGLTQGIPGPEVFRQLDKKLKG